MELSSFWREFKLKVVGFCNGQKTYKTGTEKSEIFYAESTMFSPNVAPSN